MTCGFRKASALPRFGRGPALTVATLLLQGVWPCALPGQTAGQVPAPFAVPALAQMAFETPAPALFPDARVLASTPSVSAGAELPEAPVAGAASLALARHALEAASVQSSQSGPSSDDPQQAATPAVLTGVVSDMSGALISGAKVKLVSKNGSLVREGTSDATGRYTFPDLPAGSYTVTVSSPGLETIVLTDMPVTAGDRFEVPEIPLPVARTKADVEVYAGQEQVAAAQLHIQEQQRVLGVFPNFYTSFIWDAAPLTRKQKFSLMFHSTLDPVQFGTTALVAGVWQVTNRYPGYGDGAQGYAKRYGAAYATTFLGRFLGSAVYPSIFGQDPRYFYQGTGGVRSRAWHAISSSFICRGDSGHRQVHYSHILGSMSAGALSNLYHPKSDRGVGLTLSNAGLALGGGAAVNLVREFVLKGFTHKVPVYANGKPANDALKQ